MMEPSIINTPKKDIILFNAPTNSLTLDLISKQINFCISSEITS